MSDTNNNMRLWNALGKTDPAQTKKFQRSGGFKGTAIKPMYCNQKMTEAFGPCGIGWGPEEPHFETREAADELLVFCTVGLWYKDGNEVGRVFGVGGDKYLVKQSSGLKTSDEAFKSAYTDALGNAMKLIGVAADIHMGLFDDSKYVSEITQEFAQAASPEAKTPQVKVITAKQAEAFRAACTTHGKSPLEVKAALQQSHIDSSAKIPAEAYDSWMDWAKGA